MCQNSWLNLIQPFRGRLSFGQLHVMLAIFVHLHFQQLKFLALRVDCRTRQHCLDHVVNVRVGHITLDITLAVLIRFQDLIWLLIISLMFDEVPIKADVTGALVLQLQLGLALGLPTEDQQRAVALLQVLPLFLHKGRTDVHGVCHF